MILKQYNAIIFDFDYTLVDATKAIVKCYNYAFSKVGFPSQEILTIKKTVGMTIPEAFKLMTGCQDLEIIETFKQHFKTLADKIMTKETIVLDNAKNLLEIAKQNDLKTGILSSKKAYRINETLKKENMLHLIDIVIGFENIEQHKPLPQGIDKIAKILDINKNEILYVGDSLVDAQTAQNAKVDFIGVLTGTTTKEDFERYPYIAVLNVLLELELFLTTKNTKDTKE